METNQFFDQLTPVSLSSNPNYNGMATAHIVAGNGIFTYANTKLGWKIVQDTNYTFNENLPHLENEIHFNKDLPKIPLEAFNTMIAFYKGIYDRYKTEAQMNFYWNEHNIDELTVEDANATIQLDQIVGLKQWGNGLVSYVPVQRNSPGLTSTNDPIYHALRSQMMPFVETHSHNTMAAFKSGTDEANSYSDELQLVIGHITSDEYDFYNWVTIRGEQHDNLERSIVEQIVELPETFENKEMSEYPEVPEEWYGQHETQVLRAPKSAATMKYLTDEELAYLDHLKEDQTVVEFEDEFIDEEEHYLYRGRDAYQNGQSSFTNSGQDQKTQKEEQETIAIPEANHTSTANGHQSENNIRSQEKTKARSQAITSQKISLFKRIFNKLFKK